MLDQKYNLPQGANEILGDLAALAEQLGAADGLCLRPQATAALEAARVQSVPGLHRFLEEYAARILVPHELPAIAKAYGHVTRYELRELLDLDRSLEQDSHPEPFAKASRHIGRIQLARLRPLRGERVVQRYLRAVELSEANGWHTVVFGLVLAVYSMPLRQGLLHFTHQTLGGFVQAAQRLVTLSHSDRQRLLTTPTELATTAIGAIIAEGSARPM
jgi:urease accessory protein